MPCLEMKDPAILSLTGGHRQSLVSGLVKYTLTCECAEPLSLLKLNPMRRQVLSDRLLCQLLGDLTLEQHIEPRHASLTRDPCHARLPVQLKCDDFRTHGKVCVQENIQDSPGHLWFRAAEADAQRVSDEGSGTIGANSVFAADLATGLGRDLDKVIMFLD